MQTAFTRQKDLEGNPVKHNGPMPSERCMDFTHQIRRKGWLLEAVAIESLVSWLSRLREGLKLQSKYPKVPLLSIFFVFAKFKGDLSCNVLIHDNFCVCCRLRELNTLKGHVESVVRMKNLDIGTIQQSYTV